LPVVCIIFYHCDDVFEEDISDDTIAIIAPEQAAVIEGNFVQFRWTFLDGADNYRIQLFNENQFLVLDSLITGEVFNFPIDPGEYQWRVRAENFAFETPYTPESDFSVITSEDLSGQIIALNAPADNSFFNSGDVNFSWTAISAATFYDFQILNGINANSEVLFESNNISNTNLTVDAAVFNADQAYVWRVRAGNNTSMSSFFQRTLSKDSMSPPTPTLLGPTSGASFASETDILFSWSFSDIGAVQSTIASTIEIASDENFVNIIFSETLAALEITTSFNATGNFFWRVRGVDAAGNTGENNSTGMFTIN